MIKPRIPVYKRAIKIMNPQGSNFWYSLAKLCGSWESKTFEPSSGGIGTKLKTANIMLIFTAKIKAESKIWLGKKLLKAWYKILATEAKAKLERTPAADTISSPVRKLLKFNGFTGTGLAQAIRNPGGVPVKKEGNSRRAGKRIEPIGSMCGIGFKVSLPAFWAVLSPNFRAISPCITSWIMTENINITIAKAINSGDI